MLKDEQWPVARLIPISSASGVEAQERRAASALLAVISAVNEFGRALLKPLGAPAGRIETFVEVPFKLDGRSIRPDGLIIVSRGNKSWSAIVETKTGSNPLEPAQISAYLDLARQLNSNAVLSISNQYVTSSSDYPIELDKRRRGRVALHHWSWVDVLTEAVVQEQHRGVSDPDQAYILRELIRYLSDSRSGAVSFGDMGRSWTAVRDGTRQNTLRKNSPEVAEVASLWDDLVRFLGLELTKVLGRNVKQVLGKREQTPAARQAALRESLASSGQLFAELQVPDVAGPLEIVADLRTRQVTVSTHVDAPREGRSKGRISWLLRQLQNAPEDMHIDARIARSPASLAASLLVTRSTPDVLYPEGNKEIRRFVLGLTRNMGLKRAAGQGSFIDSVIDTTMEFYGDVLQNLRAWKAPPPKLKKPIEEPHDEVRESPQLAEAIEEAQDEMEEAASKPHVEGADQ
ncbi:MAG: hypothetical protein ACRDKF_17825 [Actinomycetota bacterium]